MQPVEIEFLIKNGTKATLEQITNDLNKVGRDGSHSIGATSTAFEDAQRQALVLCNLMGQLEGKIKELQTTPNNIDQSENIAQIDLLQKKVEELKLHIKQLEEVSEGTQVVPPSMPIAKRQFDGLHFSIQQMAREMPTLAMGPQMFFLAISNNLPIFSDELARARREYAELIKTGQKGTPVWKQVVKSLLSWQTAMTTGIMLLVMYGNEIVKSISDITGWGAAARKKREATEELIQAEKKMVDQAANAVTEITILSRAWHNLGTDMSAKKDFIAENASAFNKLGVSINNVTEAENLLVANKQAFIDAQFAKAESVVLAEVAAGKYKVLFDKQQVLDAVPKTFVQTKGSYTDGYGVRREGVITKKDSAWQDAIDEVKEAERAYDAMLARVVERQGKASEILRNANFNTIEDIKVGTIAWYKEQISQKEQYILTLSINDKIEIETLKQQIADYQKIIDDATNKNIPKVDNADKAKVALQNDYLSSLKDAKEDEIDLERATIEDKIKLIEFERDTRIKAIQDKKEAYKTKYGEDADTSGFDRQIAAEQERAEIDITKQTQEDTKASLIAMQEYLKDYGTFQQKKFAVAQEYARKIKEAQTEGERLSLQKELDAYKSNLITQDLKMNIDWVTVFGEFGGMFSEMIKPALEDAKRLVNTDEFKNADQASKQALIEAISQMEKAIGGSGTLNFKQLGVEMQAYQNSLAALNGAKQEEIEAVEKLKEAQEAYNKVLKTGTETEVSTAQTSLSNAQTSADAASENVEKQTEAANNFKQKVNDIATSLKGNMDGIVSNVNQIASSNFASAYKGILGLVGNLAGANSALGELSKKLDIPIVSWILSLLDVLKDGLGNLIGGLLDGILDAVSGIISDVLSGDLFVTIAESISKGLFNIVKSIFTLGGTFGFMSDDSDPDLQADIDRLTESNERLKNALDRLSDQMDEAPMNEATSVYKEQLDNIRDQEKNTREMMEREGAAWSNWGYGIAGLGGKSSSNKYIDDNIEGKEWDEISKLVGRDVNGAADFWGLSSEDMAKVADHAGAIYDRIKGFADEGHRDAAQYMDEYIAYAEERVELEKAYYEKLTSMPFDSLRDEFKNVLMDMSSDAEDFTDNFEKMMQNAIVESMMSKTYNTKLKEWYKSFGDAMENGDMSPGEKDALRNEYNNIVKDALAERDALKDILGMDSGSTTSQSARSGSFETMSQDQGNKLEGLFTANEMRTARIEETVERVDVQMSLAVGHLAKIEENTEDCAESLDEIKNGIKILVNDGIRVK